MRGCDFLEKNNSRRGRGNKMILWFLSWKEKRVRILGMHQTEKGGGDGERSTEHPPVVYREPSSSLQRTLSDLQRTPQQSTENPQSSIENYQSFTENPHKSTEHPQ